MQLERATIKDIKILLEIEMTTMGLKVYSGYFSEEEIMEWIKKDVIYLIRNEETVVGTISYEEKDDNHAYISGLVIKPEFQKQGLAKQAMKLLMEKLKIFKKLSLVVHPNNHAVKIYESFGFIVESFSENYFGDGEPRLIMIKGNLE